MKSLAKIISKKAIIFLLAAMAISIPSSQMAFADPLPSVSLTPQVPVQGGVATITITPALFPVNGMSLVMYEAPESPQVVPPFVGDTCLIPIIPAVATNNIWRLEDGSGTIVRFSIAAGGNAVVTFGAGGTPTVTVSGVGSSVTPPSPAYVWADKVGGNGIQADNLALLTADVGGDYQLGICGREGAAQTAFQGFSAVSTQKPVAGEILPINTTALLIAGISSNPIWVLSALAVIAGGAFTLLRLQVGRNF